MKKNNRNIVRRMLAALMIMVWMVVAAVPAFAAPKIRKAEYEGKGRVEVDFNSKVRYQNVKVTVKDDKGTSYSTKINEIYSTHSNNNRTRNFYHRFCR